MEIGGEVVTEKYRGGSIGMVEEKVNNYKKMPNEVTQSNDTSASRSITTEKNYIREEVVK